MGVSCSRNGGRLTKLDLVQAEVQEQQHHAGLLAPKSNSAPSGRGSAPADRSGALRRVLEGGGEDTEELQAALRSGDAERIEKACDKAETSGMDEAKIYLARAEARWLRAQSNLHQAFRGSDTKEREKAYYEAEAAGVETAHLPRVMASGRSGGLRPPGGPRQSCIDLLTAQATMGAALSVLFYQFAAYNLVYLGKVMAAVGKGHLCFAFGLLFNASWGMSIWCFFQAHCTDPGVVPQRWHDFVRRAGDALPVAPARLEWQPGKATMCRKCGVPRPERAHHCHVCNVCVMRMDHHCPWINNCVGFGNHKYFLLLVGYCLLTSIIALLTTFPDLIQCVMQLSSLEGGFVWEGVRVTDVMVFLIFGILACIFAGLLAPMLATHIEFAVHNVTTIEGHYESINMPNPFDQGATVANLAQIFGAFGSDWLLPVKPKRPFSDGICFLRTGETVGYSGIIGLMDGDEADADCLRGGAEEGVWRMRYQVRQISTPRENSGLTSEGGLTSLSWWWSRGGSRDPEGVEYEYDAEGRRVVSI